MAKRRWSRIGLWVFVALALSEVGARSWERFTGITTGSLYDLIVATGGRFHLRPNAHVLTRSRYGGFVEYRTNSLGYRGDEVKDRPGGRRILVLGDSIAFGVGVAWADAFPARLERSLRVAVPQSQVISLATFAYDTGDELGSWRAVGIALRPEVVVVEFYMNDFELASLERGGAAPQATLAARLNAGKNRLLAASTAYREASAAMQRMAFLLLHDLKRRHPSLLNDEEPSRWRDYLGAHLDDRAVPAFAALERLVTEIRGVGASPLLLLSPNEVQLYATEFDAIQRRVLAVGGRLGVPTVDLTPVLRADPDRARLFLDGLHLSAKGHERAAAALGPVIERLLGVGPGGSASGVREERGHVE